MKRNWIRNLIGGLGFGSVLFVFQACYGTPQDFGIDFLLEGQVKSKTTGEPIKGVKVSVPESGQAELTDNDGKFSLYTLRSDTVIIRFEDIDSTLNGYFVNQDKIITNIKDSVYLDVVLEKR